MDRRFYLLPCLGPFGSPKHRPGKRHARMLLYCLTRDHDLAAAIDERLGECLAFFYNDAARLSQAVILREPDLVLIDTGAIRVEYGDAGLGPVVGFLRERAPDARLAVRPTAGAEWLIAAEAGSVVQMVPADLDECVSAVASFTGRAAG